MSDVTDTSPAAVERYNPDWYYRAIGSVEAKMTPHPNGRCVSYSDYAALSSQLNAANARADKARDAALVAAADEYLRGSGGDSWDFFKAARDAILALRDKPAETAPQPALCSTSELQPALAVTVQDAIRDVWGCCEELEDEALVKLSVVKTEHEKGFWAGQKMTAKRIRRATQMPIAGGGDE